MDTASLLRGEKTCMGVSMIWNRQKPVDLDSPRQKWCL